MILFNIVHSNLVFRYLLLVCIISSIDSRQFSTQISFTSKLRSAEYGRLAQYCHIHDYQAWLQRQHEFTLWFDLAKILRLSLDEDMEFQQEFRKYRLQYECLRFMERLPALLGPG